MAPLQSVGSAEVLFVVQLSEVHGQFVAVAVEVAVAVVVAAVAVRREVVAAEV